ncbi:hypothetical protein JCM19239_5283 [Vibrio variabilis]|uniref:Uncharacterized protein n=1 Tax=Vibrio variabilis TaxID=990271 RepID=A0ABQ0JDE2_9VIBR|nr:hypothetical protein JCM19239_5283 [Vibrio variabilis]
MTDTGVFYTTKSGDMLDAIVYGHYEGDVSALKRSYATQETVI